MRITKVTTKAGDGGETHLAGGQKVGKDSPRIEASGAIDELNSHLGVALSVPLDEKLAPKVQRVQSELFRLGAAVSIVAEGARDVKPLSVEDRHVLQLEAEMEELLKGLTPLEEFVLPGGGAGAAALHVARTVCRRAERRVVGLSRVESVDPCVLRYLNRLSDWLFVVARWENLARGHDEPRWDRGV